MNYSGDKNDGKRYPKAFSVDLQSWVITGGRFGPPVPPNERELAQWADDGGNNLD